MHDCFVICKCMCEINTIAAKLIWIQKIKIKSRISTSCYKNINIFLKERHLFIVFFFKGPYFQFLNQVNLKRYYLFPLYCFEKNSNFYYKS